MQTSVAILLLAIALILFWAWRTHKIANDTLNAFAAILTVIAGIAAILLFIVPAPSLPPFPINTSTPESTKPSPVRTATIGKTLSSSETLQLTFTPSPTNTLVPSPTFTPTFTPLPTETKSPIGLVKGDELADNRVTLKLKEIKYEQGRTRIGSRPVAPIIFDFDFTNNSGDTILLQLDQDKFRAEDNLGNKLTCEFWNGVVETVETIQKPLGNGQTFEIAAFCGEGKIPPGVTTYILYVIDFSSLPDSTWVAEVAR